MNDYDRWWWFYAEISIHEYSAKMFFSGAEKRFVLLWIGWQRRLSFSFNHMHFHFLLKARLTRLLCFSTKNDFVLIRQRKMKILPFHTFFLLPPSKHSTKIDSYFCVGMLVGLLFLFHSSGFGAEKVLWEGKTEADSRKLKIMVK